MSAAVQVPLAVREQREQFLAQRQKREELLLQGYSEWAMFRRFWDSRKCFCCGRFGECDHREIEVARAYVERIPRRDV